MIKLCFPLIFLLCIIYSTYSEPVTYPTFDQYLQSRKKSYTAQEYALRKEIYNKRIASFANINKYTPGVNNLTDWNADEINKLKNLKTLNSPTGKTPPTPNPNNIAAFSWKGNKKITPVKNQGMCGSSWAFATVAYAQSKLIIDKRQTTVDLSEQKILQCTRQSSCTGGYIQNALQSAIQGIPTEGIFSYDPSMKYPFICSLYSMSPGDSVENYYNLNDSQLITLLQERPLVISVSANGWQNYKSGIFQCQSSDTVNYAALLVGYDSYSWYIKNSWGSDWGEEGYIRVSRTAGINCKVGASAHRTFEWQLFSTLLLVIIVCLSLI